MRRRVLLPILGLTLSLLTDTALSKPQNCGTGYQRLKDTNCIDVDECNGKDQPVCGPDATCFNTIGSHNCQCDSGYATKSRSANFTFLKESCKDINECFLKPCGPHAECKNTKGSYSCTCQRGFHSSKDVSASNDGETCKDEDECSTDSSICGEGGVCKNVEGSYQCDCQSGFSNYGNGLAKCIGLSCDRFTPVGSSEQIPAGLDKVLSLIKNSCTSLSRQEGGQLNGEKLLENILSMIDELLSGGPLDSNMKVTTLLGIVEDALRLIGPLLKNSHTRKASKLTEVEFLVERGQLPPQGEISLSSEHAHLDTHWETAAGNATYPGFAAASLITYKGLETSTNKASQGLSAKPEGTTFLMNSKVVTVSVSNMDTSNLKKPITFTFSHLQSKAANHTCVYWKASSGDGGWSEQGCRVVESNATRTVCSCTHLSSFAVLMALYEFKDTFALEMITWVGLSMSQLCLFLCVLTFYFCRSIHCTRNTIHLNLCICLFIANLVFLAGISSTQNKGGCAFVAGLLHFFFLAAFCWMCLEGVQLYRMVVLVFNTTLHPPYMMAAGYGVPAIIVIISASVYAQGYGTDRHCWLTLEHGFIWSFFGPVCVVIMVNAFFFIITVWKLAEKFSSLNPDLTNLRKIRVFTVTAVAQLCVLGTMWIFGCFLLDESTLPLAYIFTFLNSLQGALLFLMHCLFSKQVREEYAKFLSRFCTSKKKHSEFSTNQSSNSQASKSAQQTKESRT